MTVNEFLQVSCFCNVDLTFKKNEYESEDYSLMLCGDKNTPVYEQFKNFVITEIYPTDDGNVALTVGNKTKSIKTYFLYIRQYSILDDAYVLYIKKVNTDNVYRVIGKIYSTTIERIKRIDYTVWTKEKERFWVETGYNIDIYREPKLTEE